MKYKRCLSLALILLFLMNFSFFTRITAIASSDLTEDEINKGLSNVNIVLLKEEPSKKNIDCFDVRNDGTVAILQERSSNRRVICICGNKSEFLYGYEFTTNGSAVIEWNGDLLFIYLIRSEIIISVDSNGNVVDVSEYELTSEQNSQINYLTSSQREVNGTTYILQNDGIAKFLGTSYSKLVVKDGNGAETIFYESDVSSQNEMYSKIYKYAAFTVFAVLVITLTTILLMIIKKKLKK